MVPVCNVTGYWLVFTSGMTQHALCLRGVFESSVLHSLTLFSNRAAVTSCISAFLVSLYSTLPLTAGTVCSDCSTEPLILSSLCFEPFLGLPNSPLSYTSDSALPAYVPGIVSPAPSSRTEGPICPSILVRTSETRFSQAMTVDLGGTVVFEDMTPHTSFVLPFESSLSFMFRPSSKLGTSEVLASPSGGFIPAVKSHVAPRVGPTGPAHFRFRRTPFERYAFPHCSRLADMIRPRSTGSRFPVYHSFHNS
jgi:hypothetical protein